MPKEPCMVGDIEMRTYKIEFMNVDYVVTALLSHFIDVYRALIMVYGYWITVWLIILDWNNGHSFDRTRLLKIRE